MNTGTIPHEWPIFSTGCNPLYDQYKQEEYTIMSAQIYELARERHRRVLRQREDILEAFIAKYKCEPDECEQIIQQVDANTQIYYVRKRQRFDESVGVLVP